MSINIILSIVAIVLTIIIGYKFHINYGIIAMVFAYIIGGWVMGVSPKELIPMWPTSLFFTLFSVSLFFGVGMANGTIPALTDRIIYPFRNMPALIPIVLFFSAAIIAFIGPGAVSCFALLTPLYMGIAYEMGLNRGLVPLMVVGASAGGWGPIAVNGITTNNLIVSAGFSDKVAVSYTLQVWGYLSAFLILLFFIGYFIFKGHKIKNTINMKKPEPFTKEQKINVWLIVILIVVVVVPAILNKMFDSKILEKINSMTSVEFVCIILAFVALVAKLSEPKKIFKNIPLSVIAMVCGVGMLVQVAINAGTVDKLGKVINNNISVVLIPVLFALIAGVMSFFSSTIGVVMPTLFPLVYVISQNNPKLSAPLLFGCVVVGAVSTGFSPFSTQGALAMANVKENDVGGENKLFWNLIWTTVGGIAFACLFCFVASLLF